MKKSRAKRFEPGQTVEVVPEPPTSFLRDEDWVQGTYVRLEDWSGSHLHGRAWHKVHTATRVVFVPANRIRAVRQ